MNKKIGLILIVALTFLVAGCVKQEDTGEKSQTGSEQGTATGSESVGSSDGKGGAADEKKDYSNEAALQEALKEMIGKSQKLEGIQYENVVSYQGVETVQKIWQSKGKMKISTMVEGNESIAIITDEETITYDLATKQGVSYADAPQEGESEMPNIGEDEIGNFKFIGEEEIDGEPCIVVTDAAAGTATTKIWMSKNYGIMMKSEMKDANTNVTMTLSVRNLKMFKPDDHFFEVPKDITIIKM